MIEVLNLIKANLLKRSFINVPHFQRIFSYTNLKALKQMYNLRMAQPLEMIDLRI